MALKFNKKHTDEIGFRLVRIWTRFYVCVGFSDSTKNFISCYQSDKEGNVSDESLKNEITMNWPLRIFNKETNFEILKR